MVFPDEVVITITDKDIQQGKRADCYLCPMALAIKRYFGDEARVAVGLLDPVLRLYGCHLIKYETISYIFPAYIAEQLKRYDDGGEFALKEVFLKRYKNVCCVPTTKCIPESIIAH